MIGQLFVKDRIHCIRVLVGGGGRGGNGQVSGRGGGVKYSIQHIRCIRRRKNGSQLRLAKYIEERL